ncbi:pentapeptide repeat-containing protein [Modicisalibacter radicis]|uniref:pentapeptide repeat-containing protein n=1 Tax=Halomonas sp. EAR18 TaxID=2518972 RepID=UPI001443D573|nr:pentapeptide repeat-containing protein [Halomonas sp. EAR18]
MTPLNAAEVAERIAARGPAEWVDLAGCEIADVDFGHAHNATVIERFDLRGATLTRCAFTNGYLRDVKCQEARLVDCDLRYADIERTSFKRARLTGCDLYRARLGPSCIFEAADISDCSLNLARFDGVVLPRSAIAEGQCPGLLQEREADFRRFHRRLTELGRGDDPARTPLHLSRRHSEAAGIYRALSAHWASNGATRDAGWAYYQARRLETQAQRPDNVLRRRRCERAQGPGELAAPGITLGTLRWLNGALAGWVAGYGESPLRVVAATLAVVVAFALAYLTLGVAGGAADPLWLRASDALLFSAQAMTASLDADVTQRWLRWMATLETTAGITLLGLLGFCLGNRLRSA